MSLTPTRPRTEEVSPGVHAYIQPDGSWWINNAGFVVGRSAVVSVDSAATQQRAEAYRTAIHTVTDLPVTTVVNTHHHGDHTNGNYVFTGATVVGHELCRAEMLSLGLPGAALAQVWDVPEWGALALAPPTVTFADRIDVWVDDLRCEVRHVGIAAHTTNDAVVWIPERGVLFAGDLVMNGCTPYVLGGSLSGSITAITWLKALGAATIVPGHGDVCGPQALDQVLDYLLFLQGYAADAHRAGIEVVEAAARCDLGGFAQLRDRERIAANLHRAFAELEGAAPGAPIDRRLAMAHMVAYNGGDLLPSLA